MELDELVGNKDQILLLKMLADYARLKGPMRHIGLFGEYGNGKTSMAIGVARRVMRPYHYLNGRAVKSLDVIRNITRNTEPDKGCVIFIDEAHAMNNGVQDSMLSVLNRPGILVTEVADMVMRETLPPKVSFILATSEESELLPALVSRLQRIYVNGYSLMERMEIARRWFKKIGIALEAPVAASIARRSKCGRDVESHCMLISEMADVRGVPISNKMAIEVLNLSGLDANGLGPKERGVLRYLSKVGRAGIGTIGAALSMSETELANIVEPWLLRQNLIVKHKTGRVVTEKGKLAANGTPITIT